MNALLHINADSSQEVLGAVTDARRRKDYGSRMCDRLFHDVHRTIPETSPRHAALSELAARFEIGPETRLIDVWDLCWKDGVCLSSDADFERLQQLRRNLFVSSEPYPDSILLAFGTYVGVENVKIDTYDRYLGVKTSKVGLRRLRQFEDADGKLLFPRIVRLDPHAAKGGQRLFADVRKTATSANVKAHLDKVSSLVELQSQDTLLDAWYRLKDICFPLLTAADFKQMADLKKILGAAKLLHHDWMLRAFADFVGKNHVNAQSVKTHLSQKNSSATLKRLRDLEQVTRSEASRKRYNRKFWKVLDSYGLTEESRSILESLPEQVEIGSDETCKQVWNKLLEKRFRLKIASDFQNMLAVRRALTAGELAYPDWVLRRFSACVGVDNVNNESVGEYLGYQNGSEIVERVRDLINRKRRRQTKHASGEQDELFALFAHDVQAEMRQLVAQTDQPLRRKHVGRVLRIPDLGWRRFFALLLISLNLKRRRSATIANHMSLVPPTLELFEDVDPRDQHQCDAALLRYLDNWGGHESDYYRAHIVRYHLAQRKQVEEVIESDLPDFVSDLKSLVPLPFQASPTLRQKVGQIRSNAKLAARRKREEELLPILPKFEDLIEGIDARFSQVEQMFLTTAAAFQSIGKGQVACAVPLSVKVPVVAKNGKVERTSQVLHFALSSEIVLLEEMLKHPKHAKKAQQKLSQLKATQSSGQIFLEYLSAEPEHAGGIVEEPHWITPYRDGVFFRPKHLSEEHRLLRASHLEEMGLPTHFLHPTEFLGFPGRDTGMVTAMLNQGRVLIPFLPLYHAMLVAYTSARYSMLWVPRAFELLQFRIGAFGHEAICGEDLFYAKVRRKSRIAEEQLGIDVVTIGLLDDLRLLTNWRWHDSALGEDGKPKIAVVPFAIGKQDEIQPARFIFQRQNSALSPAHLALFQRFLFRGMVDVRNHAWRFVKATALGDDGVSKKVIGHTLGHARSFAETQYYDLRRATRALDAAGAFLDKMPLGSEGGAAAYG